MSDLTVVVDGQHHLVGARCTYCPTHVFPLQGTCPRCGAEMEEHVLPRAGTVWSCTVQRIEPKPPYRGNGPFVPFALGYVDLGLVRVELPLTGRTVESWRIGDEVELVVGDDDSPGPFAFAARVPRTESA